MSAMAARVQVAKSNRGPAPKSGPAPKPATPARLGASNQDLQAKLRVGPADDPLEREADRVAEVVVAGARAPPLGAAPPAPQRKCAGCAAEEREPIRRQPLEEAEEEEEIRTKAETGCATAGGAGGAEAAAGALSGGGRPLPAELRAYFEPRFGHDLGAVRLHTGAAAGRGAAAIGAEAFTLGPNIAFGAGRYDPRSGRGKRLIAHELTHVLQQRGPSDRRHAIQRQCETGSTCDPPIQGAPGQFAARELTDEEPAREAREQQTPEAVQRAGHGRRAVNLERLAAEHGLVQGVAEGIFVDLDISSDVGAWTRGCRSFFRRFGLPYSGSAQDRCIFLSEAKEQEAEEFYRDPSASTVGGRDRGVWLARTLRILGHEVQHVMFDRGRPPITGGARCSLTTELFRDPDSGRSFDVRFYLSELNAELAEFPPILHTYANATGNRQPLRDYMRGWFQRLTETGGENIGGILTALRCSCDCDEVESFVRETWRFTTQGWPAGERMTLNRNLQRKEGLNWPLTGGEPVCLDRCQLQFENSGEEGQQRLADLQACMNRCG